MKARCIQETTCKHGQWSCGFMTDYKWQCSDCGMFARTEDDVRNCIAAANATTYGTACVPDDQQTYAQRREAVARRRNPGVTYDICTGCGKHTRCENGLLTMCDQCYAAWPGVNTDPPRTSGIARAVDRLSQREPRIGCAEFMP